MHIEQEIKRLEFQKNKLLGKIKSYASSGNHAAAKPLAKQVTQINSQLQKLQQFSGKMTAVNYKVGNAASLGCRGLCTRKILRGCGTARWRYTAC